MSRLNFEQEIPGWSDFMIDCEKQVAEDKKKFYTAFFPSAVTCKKPRFCLVAMEPSLQGEKVEQVEKEVRIGRRVFFPLIVTFCAWRYLCDEKYDFHIADLDKGAKNVDDYTRKTAPERWTNWLPLLERELELLDKPPIVIALGKRLYKFLKNCKKIEIEEHEIEHYSETNKSNLEIRYKQIEKYSPFGSLPNLEDVKNFSKKYMEDFGDERYYSEEQIMRIIDGDFKYGLSEIQKIIFALYKYEFTCIKVEDYCNIGANYLKNGDYDNAIAYCNKAIRLDPNCARAHRGLEICYITQHK